MAWSRLSTLKVSKSLKSENPNERFASMVLSKAAVLKPRERRFDYLLVESTGISEPLAVPASRLGRRTFRTLPLLPPPQ